MGVQDAGIAVHVDRNCRNALFSFFLLRSGPFWEGVMSGKRITMRKIRDVLGLRLAGGLSIRQIKASTKISIGAIQKLLARAQELGLSWPLSDDLDDNRLAQLFYPGAETSGSSRYQLPVSRRVYRLP